MTGRRGRSREDRRQSEARIDAELEFHRDATVDELVAEGLSRADAEREAARRFGHGAHYRHRLVRLDTGREHAERRRETMAVIWTGIRAALRDLRRAPGFTWGVVAILTIGLGVNAITFGLVDRLVLRGPEGVVSPGELRRVVVHRRSRQGVEVATTTIGYLDYRDLVGTDAFAGAAAESSAPLLVGSGESAERVQARLVTAGYFPLLGVAPAAGRFFTEAESAEQGARQVVLGHAFWQRRFGGDPGAIGRTLEIESHRYEVVGVTPRHFTGSSVGRVDVFLPLEAASDEQVSGEWRTSRNFSWMDAIVRLAPGADPTAAAAEITARYRQAYAEDPDVDANARLELAPLNAIRGATASDELGVAGLVGAVALVVFLIAVANAANLFLARAMRRRASVALRLALGGGRARLVAEQAVEGAALALIGAVVAVSVAWAGAPAVRRLLFPDVAWLDGVVDGRLLAVLATAAVAGGAIAAALPMLQARGDDVTAWLRSGLQRDSHPRTRTQTLMLVAQGTLSVLLLVGAGLFVRSLVRAESIDLGLDTDRLLVVGQLDGAGGTPPDFTDRLRAAIDRIPGVEGTTRVSGTLPFVSSWAIRLRVPGLAERPRVDDGGPYVHAVEPGFFGLTGIDVVDGRAFEATDRAGAPAVVIVNRTMARLYWPSETAIGRCLEIGPEPAACFTVVGVVENTRREGVVEGDSLLYYVPLDQAPRQLKDSARLLIRAAAPDTTTIGRIAETTRRQALSIAPSLRYVSARSLDDIVSPQLRSWRVGAGLFGVFGVIALLVAAIGLYSVVVFDLEGRRREMGLRAALGATGSSILGLVVGNGLRVAAAGVVTGLALAWLLAPLVGGLLFTVAPRDPGVFVAAAAALMGAAFLASAVPGIRASRIDPSRALRDE